MRWKFEISFFSLLFCLTTPLWAGDSQPDPRTVQRYGPAYRYPQAGWTVLHIEGEPYERGLQHGHLMAREIAAHLKCFALMQSPQDPTGNWKHTRLLTNSLFLRNYDEEYLKEMKGIAVGASEAGASFDGRPIDLIDIMALNAWPEIMTLDGALEATPTLLEGQRFPRSTARPAPAERPLRCSAFAATGPATADGKIVFGHITMFSLYPSNFYNVWLDIKPARGHRVLMQSYPGGIQSGMDYYLNDAGIMVLETTIGQTRFNSKGMALASRIRKALQYSESIDEVVEILKKDNNGLYTNEWLLGDTKTNEIAMLELGTEKTKLWRSSKNEWFGGTEGFYWGCNNTKDLDVRLDTRPGVEGQPANMVFHPSDRDKKWLELYDRYKGKIDVEFGKLAFSTPPIVASTSVDAKFTTTDLAREMKTWALFGPPTGHSWLPTSQESKMFSDVNPLVHNPWTILTPQVPVTNTLAGARPVDLPDPQTGKLSQTKETTREREELPPAWTGTILPASDGDIWLAAGFPMYERIVARENALRAQDEDGKLTRGHQKQINLALYGCKTMVEQANRSAQEVPLTKIKADLRSDEWYQLAANKGVLLLAHLRKELGGEKFDALMDSLGKENAGKMVTTTQFLARVNPLLSGDQQKNLQKWLEEVGLPASVPGGPYAVTAFLREPAKTLIVVGTSDEAPAQREAGELLQRAIRVRRANFDVPIVTDREVTEEQLKNHHLILIGRPDSNRIVERFASSIPVVLGQRSFQVDGDFYAHPRSGFIVAAENPLQKRFSMVVIAGLEGFTTRRIAPLLVERGQPAEALVFPQQGGVQPLLLTGK